jgi:hypothetical protein
MGVEARKEDFAALIRETHRRESQPAQHGPTRTHENGASQDLHVHLAEVVAVVTGASRGAGRAIALVLGEAGRRCSLAAPHREAQNLVLKPLSGEHLAAYVGT